MLRRLARWSGWRVAIASAAYMCLAIGFMLGHSFELAKAEARRHTGENYGMILTTADAPDWWTAALFLPPAAFVVLWLWARWRASRGDG
jgi:hypothetical protein